MRIRRAGQFAPSRAALARTRTAWLTVIQDHGVRDLANGLGGSGAFPAGGVRIDTDEGPALSFNGTTHASFGALATLPPIEHLAIIARVRSTGAQGGVPGAAFGVYAGGAQGGLGVGFSGSSVGGAWLTSAGAGLAAPVAVTQGRWYTVIVQGNPSNTASTAVATWVDGAPAVRGMASSGAVSAPYNEIAFGAQHRSSGFLRWFRGDMLWAAILVGDTSNWMTDEIAAGLFADDYPYNLRAKSRSIWLPAPAVVEPVEFSGAAVAVASASGQLSTQIHMRGGGSAVASAPGALTTAVRLGGTAAAAATSAGALSTGIKLAGGAPTVASAAGALSTSIRLAGAAQAQPTASGAIVLSAGLSGAASATASATGALAAPGVGLAGAAQAVPFATGALTSAIRLNGTAAASAAAAAQLLTGIRLAAAATCQALATGSLSTAAPVPTHVGQRRRLHYLPLVRVVEGKALNRRISA